MTLYAEIDGERLDAFLARSVENLSRSGAQKLLEEGCVLLCGKPGRKNDKLKIGDTVEVTIPEPKAVDIVPKEMALDILYEDEDVLAFKDITPQMPIHILVIPKKHISMLTDLKEEDEALIGKIYTTINKIAEKISNEWCKEGG